MQTERWGFAIHRGGDVRGWFPPGATGILVYGCDDESLPVAYRVGNETVRIGVPDGEGTPSPQLEKFCHNKYKMDLIARAILSACSATPRGEGGGW